MTTTCRSSLRSCWVMGCLLPCLAGVGGCGDGRGWKETFPARMQVFYEGKPPVGATVVLRPAAGADAKTVPSTGQVGEDGTVVFSTYRANDGAPAGDFLVTAFWYANGAPPNKLPERYADPATSGLRVRIENQPNELATVQLHR